MARSYRSSLPHHGGNKPHVYHKVKRLAMKRARRALNRDFGAFTRSAREALRMNRPGWDDLQALARDHERPWHLFMK